MRKLLGCFFVLWVMTLSSYANAQELKAKQTELSCDGITIRITSKCREFIGSGSDCSEQIISIVDKKNGKTIDIPAAGKLLVGEVGNGIDPSLDFLLTYITCLKDNKETYLVLEYGNGGNCSTCEWMEIYDLKGRKLAGRKNGRNLSNKDILNIAKIYKKLGLPVPIPATKGSSMQIDLYEK